MLTGVMEDVLGFSRQAVSNTPHRRPPTPAVAIDRGRARDRNPLEHASSIHVKLQHPPRPSSCPPEDHEDEFFDIFGDTGQLLGTSAPAGNGFDRAGAQSLCRTALSQV